MKHLLFLLAFFLFYIPVFSQNNEPPKTDTTVVITEDYGIISQKAVTGKCAILNIYRPKTRRKSFASFTININDSPVCKIKSHNRYVIKIYKFGTTGIWARSEKRTDLIMKLEMGKEYYLKCKVKPGMWSEIPSLVLMEPKKGKEEFDEAEDGD